MKNRLFEQKRTSLDFSDSESEEADYKQPKNYSKESSLEDVYSPDSKAYSPDEDSLEGSFKPTPKSILKEYTASALKGKKNITINERLNETHRIAQKNGSNLTSPEKSEGSASKDHRYNQYIREETGQSGGTHGYSSRSGDTYSSQKGGTSDEDEYDGKLDPKYSRDTGSKIGSSFKNRLVVGSQESSLSEFQKAHVRRLQQEREQELYSKGMRESADQVREKWLEEKAKRSFGSGNQERITEEEEAGGRIDRLERFEKERNRDYGYSNQKIDTFGAREAEPADKFDRIEDKIAKLQKNLDAHSKNLVEGTLKQEEKNKKLGKHYEEFEDRMNDLKEELTQSIRGSKSPDKGKVDFHSRGYSAEGTRRSKEASLYEKSSNKSKTSKAGKSTTQKSKLRKSVDRFGASKKIASVNINKKLQEEIQKLRDENYELRNRLDEKEVEEKARTKKAQSQKGVNIDREKELLETIERVKSKLRKSITKKIHQERDKQIVETRQEAAAASFGRNYSTYGFHYKDIFKRKAFEDKTAAYENYLLLNKGLPTTYKNYESPLFSQKLTKTTK